MFRACLFNYLASPIKFEIFQINLKNIQLQSERQNQGHVHYMKLPFTVVFFSGRNLVWHNCDIETRFFFFLIFFFSSGHQVS